MTNPHATAGAAFLIRTLTPADDLSGIMAVQYATWGHADAVVPHQIIAAMRNGGIVIGAYAGTRMVGFSYGFPGYKDGKAYLCSHMLAVLPEYRYNGLGRQMKLAQRQAALEKGYDLVTWTYDPLQAPNARLNLSKLGAIVRTYVPDYYGAMSDAINAGLPSDRFVVEWHLQSARVIAAAAGGPLRAAPTWMDAPHVNDGDIKSEGMWPELGRGSPRLVVLIPAQFQAVKEQDLALAQQWRKLTREIFLHYFARGYAATDFWADARYGYYLLEHGDPLAGAGF